MPVPLLGFTKTFNRRWGFDIFFDSIHTSALSDRSKASEGQELTTIGQLHDFSHPLSRMIDLYARDSAADGGHGGLGT